MPDQANDNNPPGAPFTPRPCVICRKPQTLEYKPFCSKRCADIDLGRWLGGTYAIPVQGDDDDEDGMSSHSGEPH